MIKAIRHYTVWLALLAAISNSSAKYVFFLPNSQ